MNRTALICGLLFVASKALALDATRPISAYSVDSWGMEAGLDANTVSSIAQSTDGFLWVQTGMHQFMFDGVRFRRIVTTARSNTTLSPRRAGGIWLAVPRPHGMPGVESLSDDGEVHPRKLPGSVFALEEPDGTLWAAGVEGLFRQRGEVVDRVHETPTYCIAIGRDGRVYSTGEGTVAVLDGTDVTRYGSNEGVPAGRIPAIVEYGNGIFFLASPAGVFRFENGKFLPVPGLGARTNDLLVDRDGSLWIGTDRGLARWRDGVVTVPSPGSVLASVPVDDLAEDADGSIWIGTLGEGLWRLSEGAFQTIGPPEGLSHSYVWSVVADGNAVLVAGVGGIDRIEDDRVLPLRTRRPLPSEAIGALVKDLAGDLWFTIPEALPSTVVKVSDGEVSSIDLGPFELEDRAQPHRVLAVDGDGNLWVGSESGLVQFRNGVPVRRWRTGDGLPSDSIGSIGTLADGRVWVSTRDGLAVASHVGIEPLAKGNSRYGILLEEPDREMLLTTYDSGIEAWHDGVWRSLSVPSVGLPRDGACAIIGDLNGRVWVSTDNGIYRFDRDEVRKVLVGARTTPVNVRWFGAADGMRTPECDGVGSHSAARTTDGRLWFATARGVVVVDPLKVSDFRPAPAVRIREIRAEGSPVEAGILAAGTSRFEIDYTAAALRAPTKVRFRHRLDGFDGDWVDAGDRRTAYYTNIPPGEYAFRVIAAAEGGVWSEEGASIALTISPFFWQTRAFLALAVLGVIASGVGLGRLRGRQFRARARELEREVDAATRLLATRMDEKLARTGQVARFGEFAASVAHNLKTPLTFLRGEVELLEEKRRSGKMSDAELAAALEAQLEHIRRMSDEIDTGMSFVRPGAAPVVDVDLAALAREIALLLRSRATASNVKIDIAIDGELRVRGNLDNLRHAIANLVSNAIDAMPGGGVVTISGRRVDGIAEIRVADTGPGIPDSVREKLFRPFVSTKGEQGTGLGLASCRRIVEEEHGGKIRLEPSPAGAMFVLELPS